MFIREIVWFAFGPQDKDTWMVGYPGSEEFIRCRLPEMCLGVFLEIEI